MNKFVIFNDDLVKENEAGISIFDRGFLFGDGMYFTAKIRDGVVLFFEDVKESFNKSLAKLGLKYNITMDNIYTLLAANNKLKGCFKLKIIVSSGSGSVDDLENRVPNAIYLLTEDKIKKDPIKICSFVTPIENHFVDSKSLSRIDRTVLLHSALKQGFQDAISISREGFVLELAFGNIFWIVGNRFYTPDSSLNLLFGITISKLMSIASYHGMEVIQTKTLLEDIPPEATIMRCGSFSGIVQITSIDNKPFKGRDYDLSFFREQLNLLELRYVRGKR